MIEFVLECLCEKPVCPHPNVSSDPVTSLDDDIVRTPDAGNVAGNRQAPFVWRPLAGSAHYLRIPKHEQFAGLRVVIARGQLDDTQSKADTDLRCGQANAGRSAHRIDKIINELLQPAIKASDPLALAP